MTQLVTVRLVPDGPPRVDETPALMFGDQASYSQVVLSFNNLPDPARYLRDLAATCLGMARMHEIRAEQKAAS